jgi:hypothetical protein
MAVDFTKFDTELLKSLGLPVSSLSKAGREAVEELATI